MSRRQQAGIFVYSWFNFVGVHADAAWAAGFRWLCVLEHEGAGPPSNPPGRPSSVWLNDMRARGFNIGCYGWCEGDPFPVAEAAAAAATRYRGHGLSFYVANVERPFDDRAFLTRFRELQPHAQLWLSSEISNPRDWKAWTDAGLEAWAPQCYENVNPNATPAEAMFAATRTDGHGYGIPANAVKATIGLYDPRGTATAHRYVLELDVLDQPGFSVWLGETTTQAEYATLGAGIRDHHIALLSADPEPPPDPVPPDPDTGDPIMLIGPQHGVVAEYNRLRDLDPGGTLLVKGPDGKWPSLQTLAVPLDQWKAWDKGQRTKQILVDDHDINEKAG